MKTLKAIQYTERCIAVIGDTKPLKDQLKQAGGKFNPYLKVNGSTVAGWVFSVNRKDQIAGIIEGVTIEAQPIEVKPEPIQVNTCDECEGSGLWKENETDKEQTCPKCHGNQVKPEPKPIEPIEQTQCHKMLVNYRIQDKHSGQWTFARVKNTDKLDTKWIDSIDFDINLHYPVNGYGEIKLKISPDADLSYKKPERVKEKPFKAIFKGLYNGEMTFKAAKELEKFVFELRNIPIGKDEKGRTLYKYAEGSLKVQIVQL